MRAIDHAMQELLKAAFRRSLVPWLRQQTADYEARLAQSYPPRAFPYALPLQSATWRGQQTPNQLADSLAATANAWMTRLAVNFAMPDAQALRSAAVAVLPPPYNLEAEFIPDLVISAYSPSAKDRDDARRRMLGAAVTTSMFDIDRF